MTTSDAHLAAKIAVLFHEATTGWLFRDEQAIDGVGRLDPGTRRPSDLAFAGGGRAVCAVGELLPMSEGSGEQVLTVSSNAAGDYGLYVRGSFRGVSVRAQPTDAVSVR